MLFISFDFRRCIAAIRIGIRIMLVFIFWDDYLVDVVEFAMDRDNLSNKWHVVRQEYICYLHASRQPILTFGHLIIKILQESSIFAILIRIGSSSCSSSFFSCFLLLFFGFVFFGVCNKSTFCGDAVK